jgi:hypothetical protein
MCVPSASLRSSTCSLPASKSARDPKDRDGLGAPVLIVRRHWFGHSDDVVAREVIYPVTVDLTGVDLETIDLEQRADPFLRLLSGCG